MTRFQRLIANAKSVINASEGGHFYGSKNDLGSMKGATEHANKGTDIANRAHALMKQNPSNDGVKEMAKTAHLQAGLAHSEAAKTALASGNVKLADKHLDISKQHLAKVSKIFSGGYG